MKTIWRYEVPVDDQEHDFSLTDFPRYVAVSGDHGNYKIEFWAEHLENMPPFDVTYRVFGTGHQIPDGATHVGTAPRLPNGLVFHLYETKFEGR